MHNKTTWNEKLFVGKFTHWFKWYLWEEGVVHYAIHSILYINTLKEEYNNMYEKLMHGCNENPFKGLFTNFSLVSNKIERNKLFKLPIHNKILLSKDYTYITIWK